MSVCERTMSVKIIWQAEETSTAAAPKETLHEVSAIIRRRSLSELGTCIVSAREAAFAVGGDAFRTTRTWEIAAGSSGSCCKDAGCSSVLRPLRLHVTLVVDTDALADRVGRRCAKARAK